MIALVVMKTMKVLKNNLKSNSRQRILQNMNVCTMESDKVFSHFEMCMLSQKWT